jgi:hypothetical protein
MSETSRLAGQCPWLALTRCHFVPMAADTYIGTKIDPPRAPKSLWLTPWRTKINRKLEFLVKLVISLTRNLRHDQEDQELEFSWPKSMSGQDPFHLFARIS